jgi:hypothetical protein
MFKNIYYKTLVWVSYQLGDILCNFENEWCFNLYQKCMKFSVECDEKIGFQFWQEPPLTKEHNL